MRQRLISAPVNIVLPVPVWPSTIALWLAWANRSSTIGAPLVRVRPYRCPVGSYRSEAEWSRRRGERRRVEVALGDRPRCRARQGRRARRRASRNVGDVELEPRAPAPRAGSSRAARRGPRGRPPRGAGPCRRGRSGRAPAWTDRRAAVGGRADPLALDVGELAALGGQPVGGPDLAQAGRHERHRLGARRAAGPASRPAPTPSTASSAESQPGSTSAGQRRDGMSAVATLLARDQPGLDAVLGLARPSAGVPERVELLGRRPRGRRRRGPRPRAARRVDRPPPLGLARRVEQQVRPPEPPLRGRDLAVQRGVGGQRLLDAPALGVLRHRGQVLAGITLGRDGQELERSPDAVVDVGDRLEGGVALDVPHELDAQRRKLDAASAERDANVWSVFACPSPDDRVPPRGSQPRCVQRSAHLAGRASLRPRRGDLG